MKISGKQIADKILQELKERVKKLKEKKVIPHLAVILVGEDSSSTSYVNQKKLKGEGIDAQITVKHLQPTIKQSQLLKIIGKLNSANNIHGIIVQRPLPKDLNGEQINSTISPKKDVDGFLPNSKFQPPIALAVLRILEDVYNHSPRRSPSGRIVWCIPSVTFEVARQQPRLLEGGFLNWLTSQKIVIIGKGETGGNPIINTFKKMGIEPKIIGTKTPNPQNLTKKADIIISAVGKPNIVKPEMIKKGVILIAVGMHLGEDGKLHGDYNDKKIKNFASFYTPTPGGVGPVNVAMLLENLVKATKNPLKNPL
jgi:methylenetetrahydrofolate dehydrogenase (NADP+)/methenyltetrahydrofolate cyclohydrolase